MGTLPPNFEAHNALHLCQEWREIDAIGLVADRDIAKGEELNHLYSEAPCVSWDRNYETMDGLLFIPEKIQIR